MQLLAMVRASYSVAFGERWLWRVLSNHQPTLRRQPPAPLRHRHRHPRQSYDLSRATRSFIDFYERTVLDIDETQTTPQQRMPRLQTRHGLRRVALSRRKVRGNRIKPPQWTTHSSPSSRSSYDILKISTR